MNNKKATALFCAAAALLVLLIAFLSVSLGNALSDNGGGTSDASSSVSAAGSDDHTAPPESSTTPQTTDDGTKSTSESTTAPPPPETTTEPETTTAPPPPETTAPPEPVKVTISEKSVSLDEGASRDVSFTLSPKSSDPDLLTVHVDDASVVSAVIANNGAEGTGSFVLTLKALAEGKTSVEIKYDGSAAASIDVSVKKSSTPLPPVTQTSDIDPTKPMIALTFDDGPGNYTDELLDILKKYNVHCTFFVTGNRLKKYDKSLLERMVSDGNEIGIHTWDHTKLTTLSKSEIKEEILSVRDTLQELIGYTPRLMRPPYGSTNDDVVDVCRSEGFIIVRWCLDTEDWKTRDPDKTHEAIMNNVKDGVIILCHDIHKETVAGMDRTISALIEKGYQLVTVSEMLQYSKTVPVAGDIVKRK